MKTVQMFKNGLSVYPYECEVPAYEANGWSRSEKKVKSLDKPQFKSKPINKEA